VPHITLWEPCCFTKVPDGPQTYALKVLWLQEEGAQIRMSEWSQSFTLAKNVGRGFILCSTPPTQWTVWQPQQMKMSSQGIMSCEKANNSPGLYPVKGQKSRMAYISAWKTVAYLPREKLSLLPTDCPSTPVPVPSSILDPSVDQTSPLTTGGVPVPLDQSSLVSIVTLYWG